MAEEITNNVENNATPPVTESISMAEYERLKATLDKTLKEKGDITKQLRAMQSEDERLKAEREEAQKVSDEEKEAMRQELNLIKAQNAYKNISDDKAVKKLIEAVSKADHNAIAEIIKTEVEGAVKKAEADWLNGRPEVSVGTSGQHYTKAQILEIKDAEERQRLIANNMDLFK